jgi:phosphoribosylglycinamide formyltransferase-1
MKRLAIFASGRGSNFRAIVEHARLGVLENVTVSLLITNDTTAPVLDLAKGVSVPSISIEGIQNRRFNSKQEREDARNKFDRESASILKDNRIDVVALAGFMQVLSQPILQEYRYGIMNIHPALDLTRFGGRGMYGDRVHAAVLQASENKSGCTVHYVDESVDGGPIILQTSIPVEPGDTPHTLAQRVLIQEHRTYSKAIQLHVDERIHVHDRKVTIDWSEDWEARWKERQRAFIKYQEMQVESAAAL